jgi:hypothetical protein
MSAHPHTSDPIANSGLFIGRRSTATSALAQVPPGAGTTVLTRSVDHILASGLLLLEAVLVASVWGPQPVGWLWVASQVSYLADSVAVGLLAGLAGMVVTLVLTVAVLTRLDHAWMLVRRAAGCDQREGCLERLFVLATVIAVPVFLLWLFVIEGPGSLMFPMQGG